MHPLLCILFVLLAALLALVAVVLLRTLRFVPKAQRVADTEKVPFDRERSIEALSQLIRCRTISCDDHAKEEEAEFQKLLELLPTLYPHVYEHCTLTSFPGRALLFRLKGKEAGAPTVLMAHYDVVDVAEEHWEKPPFAAVLEDGVLWGRGTLDTKVTFHGILFAADTLLARGFVPTHDIYFAFSGGEEVNGDGARNIVSYFESEQITPALVLDEGGAVVEHVFPGVHRPCAMVGLAEKGLMNVRFSVKSPGGHASAPKPGSPLVALSEACLAIENHPFPAHITPPVAALFDTLGRESSFVYRMIFANLWLFGGLLNAIAKKSGGEMNALLRTTVAFTQAEGSTGANVIPPKATMVANMRLNPEDTVEGALARLRRVVNNEAVAVEKIYGENPSRVSLPDTDGYHRVEQAIKGTWDNVPVVPYLMVQCSDSRHWGRISERVYRFSAMDLTAEERATIHGNNERIRTETVHRAVQFFLKLMLQS